MGTVAYMSPEQARAEQATAASDMYAFGVMLQELFTGRHPHPPAIHGQALLERVQRGETERPFGVSRDLASLLERLTAPAPANRPTAIDAAERLRWIREKPKRRLRALAIAGAVVLAAGAGVKYTIDLARERTLAVEARDEADKRREQAESLIAFMIGDLRRKLEPVGRIDVLDDVGAKAMEYFGAVPEHQLSDKELLRRSTALYQIGSVRITQGRLQDATAPLEQSLALAATLSSRAPQDTERLFELGQSRFWVGFVHWRRRNLDEALTHFNEYLRISEKLVALAPANADWQLELSYANSNIGSVLEERGDLESALAKFSECVRIEEALLQARPDDNTLRRSLAASHNTVGVVLRALGRLDDALAQHRVELALQQELVAREPLDTRWQQYLGVAQNYVGIVMNARGNHTEAMKLLGSALATFEQLAARDKGNLTWQREVGRGFFWLGYARFTAAAPDALGDLNRAVDVLEAIARADPTNVGWQRDVSQARQVRGEAFRAGGRLSEASADAQAALERADAVLAKSRDDREAARLRSLALILRGDIQAQRADAAAAARDWQEALATIEPLARASMDYRYLEPWARVLAATGRSQDAATVIARLNTIGYRTRETPLHGHATRTGPTSTSK
jgi:serine/threonine-protein kinase